MFSTDHSVMQCFVEIHRTNLALLCGLFTSVVGYRLLLHPLRSFPGPFAARVSTLWVFWENWPDLRLYVNLRKLHDHHGDFVRISKVRDHAQIVVC